MFLGQPPSFFFVCSLFWPRFAAGQGLKQHARPVLSFRTDPTYAPLESQLQKDTKCVRLKWSRGVTVSTLDSESSDRGSNPRETCLYLV